jgi:hypothetical protein
MPFFPVPDRKGQPVASPEQDAVRAALEEIPPRDGAVLVGYGLVAEWEEVSGERLLTRLMGDGGNPWQAKGYFYDGLTTNWPAEAPGGSAGEHHNPGHPSGWMEIGR